MTVHDINSSGADRVVGEQLPTSYIITLITGQPEMLQNVRAEILQQLSARGDKLSQEAEFSPWLSQLEPINTF